MVQTKSKKDLLRVISLMLALLILAGLMPAQIPVARAFSTDGVKDRLVLTNQDSASDTGIGPAVFHFEGNAKIKYPSAAPTRTESVLYKADLQNGTGSPVLEIPDTMLEAYGKDSNGILPGEQDDMVRQVKTWLSDAKRFPNCEFVSYSQQSTPSAALTLDPKLEIFFKTLYQFVGVERENAMLDRLTLYLVANIDKVDAQTLADIESAYKYNLQQAGLLGSCGNHYVYYQNDPEWANQKYGDFTFNSNGSLPTSMAMVLSAYDRKEHLPNSLGQNVAVDGFTSITGAVKKNASKTEVISGLKNGQLAIVDTTEEPFTYSEHFMALLECKEVNGKTMFLVADPFKGQGYKIDGITKNDDGTFWMDVDLVSKSAGNMGFILFSQKTEQVPIQKSEQSITLAADWDGPWFELGNPAKQIKANAKLPDPSTDRMWVLSGGYVSADFLTDESGNLNLNWWDPTAENYICPGEYTVTQKSAPKGYSDTTESRSITLSYDPETKLAESSGPLTFMNGKFHFLKILKVGNGDNLDGAVFNVYKNDQLIGSVQTDKNGEAEFKGENGLDNGYYEIEEIHAPNGFILPKTDARTAGVNIDTSDTDTYEHTLSVTNYQYPTIVIEKKAAGTDTGLDGAVFEVTIDGVAFTTEATEGGRIEITHGEYGDYLNPENESHTIIVREKVAPAGYFIDQDYQEGTIKKGQTLNPFTFTDTPYPSFTITKLKEGTTTGLPGAIFKVTVDGSAFETKPSDENGFIKVDYKQYGKFLDETKTEHSILVEEIVAPKGYLLPQEGENRVQEHVLRNGQAVENFTFYDVEYPHILITKRNRETNAPLPNTEFQVKIDGAAIGTFTTDEHGQVLIDYKQYENFLNEKNFGNWAVEVTETKVPDKYNLDDQPEGVGATITKVLQYQAKALEFNFVDTSYRDIKVVKMDTQTNWPLRDATFILHCVNADNQKSGQVADRVGTTNADGEFIFEDVPNGTYELYESSAPFGYDIDSGYWADTREHGKRTVIVKSDNDPLTTFTYTNEPKSGLLIRKIDAVTKQPIPNVRFQITPLAPLTDPSWEATTDDNGLITEENLPSGSYEIREISTVDGYILNTEPQVQEVSNQHDAYTVTFTNNQKNMLNILKLDSQTGFPLAGATFSISEFNGSHVGNVITGPYGYANYPNLKPGSYIVKEVKAPAGHNIDENPQTLEIKETASGQNYTLTFYDVPYANLFIRKYDALTGIGLEGATFKVWHGDGKVVEESIKTDHEGFIHLNKLEADTYYIQEIKAPIGYMLNSEKYYVQLEDGETRTIEVPNQKAGSVAVRKIDSATKAPLSGAEFALTDADGSMIGKRTTGQDGYARWSNVEPGWYVLTELTAPDGYQISKDPMNIEVKEFESTELEWENDQNASITIVKRDKESNEKLSGATFEIHSATGTLIDTLTTDTTGTVTSDRLEPGWYRIQETRAPDGYLLNEKAVDVEVKANIPATVDMYNTPKTNIVIHKVDALTKLPLANATIELYTMANELVGSFTTDSSGTITTSGLEPGLYKLQETKNPDGYVVSDTPQTVEVKADGETIVTIENFPARVIQVYLVDSTTKDPIQDAEFEVVDKSGRIVELFTTDKTGWGHSLSLDYGEYTIRQTKAPSGFSVAVEQKIEVNSKMNAILRLENTPSTTLHISKVDKETRKALAGAEFELRFDTGHGDCTYIGTFVTDENGMIETDTLTPGFYMIKETKAPIGYDILKEEIRYCVKAGEYNHVVVEDTALGSLTIKKLDSKTNEPISGAVFKVENADTSDLVGLKTTDANGEATFAGLKEGFYIVTESQGPDNYTKTPCSKTIHVEYGKKAYLEFKNAENGSLKITLQDKHTNKFLAEGQFIVTRESDQTVVFDSKTDETGTLILGTLLPGWYTVCQTYAPDKYTIIESQMKIEIKEGQQSTVSFFNETAGLIIEKVDAQTPSLTLEGARFQVRRNGDGIVVGEFVTGKDGLAMVDGLSDGLYTITELAAPVGYALDADPQIVHVRGGETAHANFQDTKVSSITVHAVDKSSQAPLTGVTVEIWNGVLVASYTSDTTGLIQTDKIPAGKYELRVVKIPDGYKLSGEANVEVTLVDGIETTYKYEFVSGGVLKIMSEDSDGRALGGMNVSVTKIDGALVGNYTTGSDGSVMVSPIDPDWYIITENTAPDGYTLPATTLQRVEVKTSETANVVFKHSKTFGLQISTVCLTNNTKVAGAVYQITTLDGAVIGNCTSAANGLTFTPLEPGTYVVKPVSVPNGYSFVDTTPKNITVIADGLTKMDFAVEQRSSMRIKIVDGTTKNGLYGVRLLVKNAEQVMKEYITDNTGMVILDSSLLVGGYTIEMVSAPEGYIVDRTPKSVSTLVGQTSEIVWALYKEGGQLQIVVTSEDENKVLGKPKGSLLQGAVFQISNAATNQVVDQIISDAAGVAASKSLLIGRYYITMTGAPAYYSVNKEWKKELQVKLDNDVVRASATCKSVQLNSGIELKSNANVKPGLTMRVDVIKAKNDSDVRMDNFFVHIKVPTDAARITTFSSGKWNQPVFYKIRYKTNMNDYRDLTTNASSTAVTQFGLSTQSLGLQAGEYVTDVRLEFGTVPAGFAMTEKMCFTQYVLGTVTDGFKIVNRAEIGGQYNTVNVSTQHIDANNPISSSGAVIINGAGNQGEYGGTGSLGISGNSGQWRTGTSIWTTNVKR